jgi:Cof subfamily protein (haloacid dehalogenase superfamily)
MYKALITDLDGTAVPLTSMGQDVDDLTREAIRLAQERGFHISCATGRYWKSTKPVVKALGLKSLCVIQGGTAIIDSQTEEIRWQKFMAEGSTQPVLDIFKQVAHDKGWLMTSHNPTGSDLKDVQSLPENLNYMYLIGIPEVTAHEVAKAINSLDIAVAHMTPSWQGQGLVDVHVTHPEATKEHAIKVWHELEGVEVEETIGMGDSGNDLPLFQAAGLKVAVGNASQLLKDAADYIAPDVHSHALKHVIDKFLLSQP